MHNKRLEALRASPGAERRPADLEIIASQYAIKFRKVTGTHVVFIHPAVPDCVAVPMKAPIRAAHVKAFVAMVDRMDDGTAPVRLRTLAPGTAVDLAAYPAQVAPLPEAEGGGFAVRFPDVPGCLGIGATPEAAEADGRLALFAAIDALKAADRAPPEPGAMQDTKAEA
ncbi:MULTISPECIES: type II toxin-antitoxin system HicB family antitoxin [Xanthobacter]|uniref:type II toxin-antitoxin system HicB family antitoxin n=1 Tax=Xanthobacter TaxID=279 RepID=UPI001D50A367|nr:putative RNase H-like HicB family nuclease [Xanthobacter flavus]